MLSLVDSAVVAALVGGLSLVVGGRVPFFSARQQNPVCGVPDEELVFWAAALACGEQKNNTLLGSHSIPTPPKPRQRDNVSTTTSQAKPFK